MTGARKGGQDRVAVRRVYEEPRPDDGARVLVDRLWPRGLAKEAARLDDWAKEVAPSSELRRWYGHTPEKFEAFAERYRAELAEPAGREAVDRLRRLAAQGPLTLLTATRDLSHAHAGVLAEVVRDTAD
ncbi:DUF488 domain-containing protein [Streptomyces sp. NPDC018031]|uniref:DUF488 domain-containing protein n=1 Tax=Streptomyces sp. NPDC018031 TaxID=3365033 RepID=UPI0037A912B5